MNTYVAIYNGRKTEIKAKDLYGAKQAAIRYFSVKPNRQSQIGIYLAALEDGTEVNIIPQTC